MLIVAVSGLAVAVLLVLLAWWTGRAAVALIPAVWLVGASAALYLSDDLYSRIDEDVQAVVLFWSVIAVVGALVGAIVNGATSKRSPQGIG